MSYMKTMKQIKILKLIKRWYVQERVSIRNSWNRKLIIIIYYWNTELGELEDFFLVTLVRNAYIMFI